MKTIIAALAIVVSGLIIGGTSAASADTAPRPVKSHAETINYIDRPCRIEDQRTSCVWNAHTAGNGRGVSFIVTMRGKIIWDDGTVARLSNPKRLLKRNRAWLRAHHRKVVRETIRVGR